MWCGILASSFQRYRAESNTIKIFLIMSVMYPRKLYDKKLLGTSHEHIMTKFHVTS